MRILLTNDDGIEAPGIRALYGAICDLGEVHVVAPASVQSATSHGVTFHKTIIASPRCVDHACEGGQTPFEGIAVSGRPADCIKLAFSAGLVPQPIDLVISGMNAGANIGINVIYSGTVAAAIEAAVMGIPSIAVSLHLGKSASPRWADAACHARSVIDQILEHPLDPHMVLNLNVPILDEGEPRGLRVLPISTSPIVDLYELEQEVEDARHYRFAGGMQFRHMPPGSDVEALFDRYMTLTPLHFDLTHLSDLQQWSSRLKLPAPPASAEP